MKFLVVLAIFSTVTAVWAVTNDPSYGSKNDKHDDYPYTKYRPIYSKPISPNYRPPLSATNNLRPIVIASVRPFHSYITGMGYGYGTGSGIISSGTGYGYGTGSGSGTGAEYIYKPNHGGYPEESFYQPTYGDYGIYDPYYGYGSGYIYDPYYYGSYKHGIKQGSGYDYIDWARH